ncbi:MAG: hypothetical protein J6K28_08815, partial [Alistipes sp.]|nr:hypothetical protein [Alistipes sp.]
MFTSYFKLFLLSFSVSAYRITENVFLKIHIDNPSESPLSAFATFNRKSGSKLPHGELLRVRSFVERLRMLRKFVNKLSPSHFVRLHSELILKVRGAVYRNPRYPRGGSFVDLFYCQKIFQQSNKHNIA